jgi:hypothetical protein
MRETNGMRRMLGKRHILAAVSSVIVAASAQPVLAQEGTVIRNLLGSIGVIPAPQEQIEYRERAPLVVPPAASLRPPEAPVVDRRTNWPKDPDVEARKAAAKDSLLPATEREKYIQGQRPLLSQEELRRGRIQGSGPTGPYRSAFDESPHETMVQPILQGREIAARRSERAINNVKLGEEPPRRYLSDPPVGLRRAAGTGEFTQTKDAPPPVQSRYGQREFIEEQNRR